MEIGRLLGHLALCMKENLSVDIYVEMAPILELIIQHTKEVGN